MRKALVFVTMFVALSGAGCKKKVPNDIVQKTLKGALSGHAPATTSAMCGTRVKGLPTPTITVTSMKPDNTGLAHVKGAPWLAAGAPPVCEGDIEFKYTYTSKTTGYKRKTTTTTWYLEHVKLLAVQTPGVANATADEDPDGDGDDD